MNYNLEGMTKAEGHSYVAAKLNGAGCTQTVFEDNALEAILNAANGTPRMINKLCNASLLVGNSSNLNIITADASCRQSMTVNSDSFRNHHVR